MSEKKNNDSLVLLNEYIKEKFKKSSSIETIMNDFEKIDSFIKKNNIELEINLLSDIINSNDNIKKALKQIIDKNINKIKSIDLENVFNSQTLILAIETYCMLYDIEINDFYTLESIEKENVSSKDIDIIDAYYKELINIPLLSPEEEKELATKVSQGDFKAREKLIKSNLRLVVNIAKKYQGRGLELADLIQEGNAGLITAINKFDVTKGFKISTYATHWIKQAIIRAISNSSRNIRIPAHLQEKITKYKNISLRLEMELHRKPTYEEIANKMEISVEKALELAKLQNDTCSLNEPVGDEDNSELEDFIPSSTETPEEIVIRKSLNPQIKAILKSLSILSRREKEIVILRFGLNDPDGTIKSLEEIAKKYNLTRERVRQIVATALSKIKKSDEVKKLAEYTEDSEYSLQKIGYRNFRRENIKPTVIKTPTIYEYFRMYSKNQIDTVLSSLSENERKILQKVYGKNFMDCANLNLNTEEINFLYGQLMPKLRKTLYNLTEMKKQEHILKQKTIIDVTISQLKELGEENDILITEPNNINNNEYNELLKIIKTPSVQSFFDTLSIQGLIIFSLKFGILKGKCFTIDSITNFLKLKEESIKEMLEKSLQQFSSERNILLENIIEIIKQQNFDNDTPKTKKIIKE